MADAIDGVLAAGNLPLWIIPAASLTTEPTDEVKSIPLAVLTGATTVKGDCYSDFGDVSISRTPTTRERQRMCQKVVETITTGQTIDISMSYVFDQQAATSAEVNEVYAALPEGATVYLARAYGWDTDTTPTAATKVDLYKATVQMVTRNEPAGGEEDLKVTATLSGSAYWADVTLTAA